MNAARRRADERLVFRSRPRRISTLGLLTPKAPAAATLRARQRLHLAPTFTPLCSGRRRIDTLRPVVPGPGLEGPVLSVTVARSTRGRRCVGPPPFLCLPESTLRSLLVSVVCRPPNADSRCVLAASFRLLQAAAPDLMSSARLGDGRSCAGPGRSEHAEVTLVLVRARRPHPSFRQRPHPLIDSKSSSRKK